MATLSELYNANLVYCLVTQVHGSSVVDKISGREISPKGVLIRCHDSFLLSHICYSADNALCMEHTYYTLDKQGHPKPDEE